MNFFELLKQYCQKFSISGDYNASTPSAFLASLTNADDTVKAVIAAYGQAQDETAAMGVLASAALSTELLVGDVPQQPVNEPQKPLIATQQPLNIPQQPVNVPQQPLNIPQQPVNVPQQPLNIPQQPLNAPDTQPPDMLSSQVLQDVQALKQLGGQMARFIQQQGQINGQMAAYMQKGQAADQQTAMIGMVTEAVKSGLPEHRKGYWLKMVTGGQITDAASLKAFLDEDKATEVTHAMHVTESFRDLPVSVRHLAGIQLGASDKDIPHLRAKMLFKAPCTQAEQTLIAQRGVRAYQTLDDMYKDLVPGDSEYKGLPYGGTGEKYRQWYQRYVTEGVAAGDEVVKSTDFGNILLQVVGELGLSRWETLDKSFLQLCEQGPNFINYIDSNVVVYGAAPDMKEWSEETGYPELEAGARQPVTTRVKDWGGIMRWSKRVVIDNRLDMITEDVNAQIDACWRAVGRTVFDNVLAWGIPAGGTVPVINGLRLQDGEGVLYNAGGTRRNYVDGDGRAYGNQVKLLALMLEQEDIAKANQTPQMLNLTPGLVVCVNTAWAVINGYWNSPYKPGTESEPNELGLPTGQKPTVIGVHQGFLRGRKDFVAFLPNPALRGVIRIQYFNGQTQPKITWQNQPPMGRVFENGEIAAQFDFPLRLTMVRSKGIFSAHNSNQ